MGGILEHTKNSFTTLVIDLILTKPFFKIADISICETVNQTV